MTSPFHNALAAALVRATAATANGVAVYRRGGDELSLAAICSPKDYKAVNGEGLVITFHCHDWLIIAERLILNGEAITPAAGDRIIDAGGEVHEVLNVPGLNCYDSGFDGIHYRVHTKKIGQEAQA
jgi:hypothetical protein